MTTTVRNKRARENNKNLKIIKKKETNSIIRIKIVEFISSSDKKIKMVHDPAKLQTFLSNSLNTD